MSEDLKHKKFSMTAGIVLVIVTSIIAVSAVLYFYPMHSVKTIDLTSFTPEEREAINIAQEFLVKTPTFTFDGIKDSVTLMQPIEIMKSNSSQYVIQLEFDSNHAGYGDRSQQVLAQVITHHVTQITVSNKEVISALVDKSWDELKQVSITSEVNSSLQITTDKDQYKIGKTINITITNQGNTRLFPIGWGYSVIGIDGQKYAPNGVLRMMLVALPPGESIHWTWNQLDSNGTQVNTGKYHIVGAYMEDGTQKEVSNFKEFEITN